MHSHVYTQRVKLFLNSKFFHCQKEKKGGLGEENLMHFPQETCMLDGDIEQSNNTQEECHILPGEWARSFLLSSPLTRVAWLGVFGSKL